MSVYVMGEKGGEIVSGNNDMTGGPYRVLQVITEAACDDIVISGVVGYTGLETTIPVGTYIFGQGITTYSQTSGLVYLAK